MQSERLQFCAVYCAHEFCAKEIDAITLDNMQEVLDRVQQYMNAIRCGQGVMPALAALIEAARVCWPKAAPMAAQQQETRITATDTKESAASNPSMLPGFDVVIE